MNATSRAILQTVLATDPSLTLVERDTIQHVMDGLVEAVKSTANGNDERLLVTQKQVATMLGVNRVTVWRMTRDAVLHPVEILPGTWRYSWAEVAELAKIGCQREPTPARVISAA